MAENPIPDISDSSLQGIFQGLEGAPLCVIAVAIRDGRLWLQRRTVDFPQEAFESVVGLISADFEKEKSKNVKEKPDGDKTKTRRCRTRR